MPSTAIELMRIVVSNQLALPGLARITVLIAPGPAIKGTPNGTIAAIALDKGLFLVREMHDMGKDGTQQIDYVIDCSKLSVFKWFETDGLIS